MSTPESAGYRCACPSWCPLQCTEVRFSMPREFDPETTDILSDELCECPCHDDIYDDGDNEPDE